MPTGASVKWAVFAILFTAGLLTLVCGLGSCLPLKKHEAVVELCCYEILGGEKHYGFENGEESARLLETIERIGEDWRSSGFRSTVGNRLRAEGLDEEIKDCVASAKIEIRSAKACVVVTTRSEDGKIASECATGLANAIVDLQAESEKCRVMQCIEQLKHNCAKRERCVVRLAKMLDAAKAKPADIAGGEIAGLEKELSMQRRMLDGMRETVSRMSEEKEMGLFFEKKIQ